MKGCIYKLDGRVFNSELELDDFLLLSYPLRAELGDLVFSTVMSQAQKDAMAKLHNITKESERLESIYKKGERIWDEDGKSYRYKKPYIGVNSFLSKHKNEHGTQLYPEFRSESYWKKRWKEWKAGNFSDYEKMVFGQDQGPITDQKMLEEYKNKVEEAWEAQCLKGDAIHSVLELYFTLNSEGSDNPIYNKDVWNEDKFLEELHKLEYKKRDKSYVKFGTLMTDEQVKNLLGQLKSFEEALKDRFGETAMFFPEFRITAQAKEGTIEDGTKLLGVIDLLVIDEEGIPHVVDYKTSPKHFKDFDSSKKLAFRYQTATYKRMLGQNDFNIDQSRQYIVPIQLIDFNKDNEGNYTFKELQFSNGFLEQLDNGGEHFQKRLNEVLYLPYITNVDVEDLMQNVVKVLQTWFPGYQQFRKWTDEEIRNEIKETEFGFEKNPKTDMYEYRPPRAQSDYLIQAKTETELFNKVREYKDFLPTHRLDLVNQVIMGLKQGIKQGNPEVKFPKTRNNKGVTASSVWFKNEMRKYCNANWKVMEGKNYEALKHFGLIVLYNQGTKQFDFVKISTQNHKFKHVFDKNSHNRNTLAGAVKTDVYYASKEDSLILENTVGNIELMETMIVINNLKNIFGTNGIVGNMQVIDPTTGRAISATNEQLFYNFDQLNKIHGNTVDNNFRKEIGLASLAHITNTLLNDVLSIGSRPDVNWGGEFYKFKDFEPAASMLDQVVDTTTENKIEALKKIIKMLEDSDARNDELQNITTDSTIANSNLRLVYNHALLALAELQGINFKQQIDKHGKWGESLAVHRKGLSGTYIDNPGNLSSETLNLLTKKVTEAYQNVRQDLQKPVADVRELVIELQKEKNFGFVKKTTFGNQADLYKNMYVFENGDMKFKNPWKDNTLSAVETKFLKYAITRINQNRHPDLTESEIQEMINNDDASYFRIPLAKGDVSSMTSQKGLLNALKDKLKMFDPKVFMARTKDALEGIFTDEQRDANSKNLFQLVNYFDAGEDEGERLNLISKKGGYEYFETNLETLLLKHEFAYAQHKRINEVFPTIKAAMIHLANQGMMVNEEFQQDLEYATNYIKNRIKNESIVEDPNKPLEAVALQIRGITSQLALAFSPVQMIYQSIQGLWQDLLLIYKNIGTDSPFTFSNFAKSFKVVYKSLANFSDVPNVVEALNMLYGINDMDMNTYVDKIKTDQHGMFNFNNFMMKFSSRPDFYNRMSIFVAKMIEDGSYEAHSVDEKGLLKYDWTKDKRFSQFANGNTGHPDYKKQRALYYAMAKQFEIENTMVEVDGEMVPFKVNSTKPMPLPRAYTNQEAESMKALGDSIYGYYSHEKKSMMNSTLVGAMWMQFKTYWSGKKNQYLQKGGVKLEGRWVHYEEDGKKYYYQVDEDGTIRYDLEPVTEDTGAPVIQWEGDWKEGILLTVFELTSGMANRGFGAWRDIWYAEDPKLRQAYRSNLRQLAYDVVMYAVIGGFVSGMLIDWYDDEEKNKKDDNSFSTGMYLTAMNIMIMSLRNSALDFNFIDSISAPVVQWTPFSFSQIAVQVENIYKLALGEQDVFDAMSRATSVGRQFAPFLDRVNVNLFGEDE